MEHAGLDLVALIASGCSKGWPGIIFVLILTGTLAGIVLIVSIQMLNLTVATGMLNGTIFYVNIIAANFSTFIPGKRSSQFTKLVGRVNPVDHAIFVNFSLEKSKIKNCR